MKIDYYSPTGYPDDPNVHEDDDQDYSTCKHCGNDYIMDESNSDFKKSFCSINCEHHNFEDRFEFIELSDNG